MLYPPGFYYVKRFVILSSDKSSQRNLSCFFDIKNPRRIEHLQSEEPFIGILVIKARQNTSMSTQLKYGSEEQGSSLYKCSPLLGFFMSKKLERLRSELLSEDKITNLLGFLTK